MQDSPGRPFRVLSLDGGGMRGLYTSILLDRIMRNVVDHQQLDGIDLDIGKGFDLIVGTSTGGIIACGLAAGVKMDNIIEIYKNAGHRIFRDPMPQRQLSLFMWLARHLNSPANDSEALSDELQKCFGDVTLRDIYQSREIALCIPSVNMKTQQSWLFKTPHDFSRPSQRSDYKVVDVCLATSAAPLYFPLASIDDPKASGMHYAFADGGLWANNPVIIGLVEALEMAGPDRAIDIISISTCAPPSGEPILRERTSWGVIKWQGGSKALMASLCAQSSRYTGIAKVLTDHLRQPCRVLRLEGSAPSAEQACHMNLDGASKEAVDVLSDLARDDADRYWDLAVKAASRTELQSHHARGKAGRGFDDFSILMEVFLDIPPTDSPPITSQLGSNGCGGSPPARIN